MCGKEVSEALKRLTEAMNGLNIGGIMCVDILGTEYEVSFQSVEQNQKLEKVMGYCEQYSKKIVVGDFEDVKKDPMCVENLEELQKKVLRHEIIHAFFGESGLRSCSEYAEDEELVDWIAIQFPKILKAFNEVNAL